MTLPYRILVLDDDEHALSGIVEMLRDAGHHVTGAATFDAAKRLLALSAFDLLVTDVRLRSFNGLHLVMQCRAEHPDIAIIIISGYDEPLMELEASRYSAAFIRKPLQIAPFLEAVRKALDGVRRQRRWPRKRVVGGFRVTVAGRPAAVVDVCYGGLRLEVPDRETLPSTFDVEVAGIGLHLQVQPVWSNASGDGTVVGAALAAEQSAEARTWRAIVDRLSA
ncbi:MAG TPA: response regulator [Vicinamibacterales bacterium]|nr:response regulator [Vicinamibacterales bacterium]